MDYSEQSIGEIMTDHEGSSIEDWLLPGMIVRAVSPRYENNAFTISRVLYIRRSGGTTTIRIDGSNVDHHPDQVYLVSRAGL